MTNSSKRIGNTRQAVRAIVDQSQKIRQRAVTISCWWRISSFHSWTRPTSARSTICNRAKRRNSWRWRRRSTKTKTPKFWDTTTGYPTWRWNSRIRKIRRASSFDRCSDCSELKCSWEKGWNRSQRRCRACSRGYRSGGKERTCNIRIARCISPGRTSCSSP